HQGGLRVYTSLDMELQQAANRAVLDGLVAYERRHGWKGRLFNVRLAGASLENYQHPDWNETLAPGNCVHGLVTSVSSATATVKIGTYTATITAADAAWTHRRIPQLLKVGDVVYVK